MSRIFTFFILFGRVSFFVCKFVYSLTLRLCEALKGTFAQVMEIFREKGSQTGYVVLFAKADKQIV